MLGIEGLDADPLVERLPTGGVREQLEEERLPGVHLHRLRILDRLRIARHLAVKPARLLPPLSGERLDPDPVRPPPRAETCTV